MKKFLKKIWKPVLIVLVFAFSFWLLLKDCDVKALFSDIKNMNSWWLTAAIAMVFAQIFVQGLCYQVMCHKYALKFNPFLGFGYCSIDLFFSQVTPFAVGGQPVMVYQMSKNGLPGAKTTTMVLLYSFLNKLALIIMAIVAAIFYSEIFFTDSWLMIVLLIVGIISNLAIGSLSILCMFAGPLVYKICTKFYYFGNKHHFIKNPEEKLLKLQKTLADFKESNKFIKDHLLVSLFVLLLCILKRVVTFATGYFIYRGLGLNEASFFYIICVQTVVAVTSDSFPIPGGVGAYETTCNTLYQGIYLNQSTTSTALLLVRGISYYGLIIVSGVTTIIMSAFTKAHSKKKIIEEDIIEDNILEKEDNINE